MSGEVMVERLSRLSLGWLAEEHACRRTRDNGLPHCEVIAAQSLMQSDY